MSNNGLNNSTGSARVIAVKNLQEFFRDSLESALQKRKVTARPHTTHYVVNLLTMFARSDQFYEQTDDGMALRPLAFMLGDALEAPSDRERYQMMQRLGDVALFMAGFFARGFASKAVDIDYYISMGGTAYGCLSDSMRGNATPQVLCDIFAELAAKFQPFVDVLNEVSEAAYVHSDKDIVRLYEIWRRTGSQRAADKLREFGVVPIACTPRDRSQ